MNHTVSFGTRSIPVRYERWMSLCACAWRQRVHGERSSACSRGKRNGSHNTQQRKLLLAHQWTHNNTPDSETLVETPAEGIRTIICDRDNREEFIDALKRSKDTWDAVVDFSAFNREDMQAAVTGLLGRVRHYVYISSDSVYEVCIPQNTPRKEEHAVRPQVQRTLCCSLLTQLSKGPTRTRSTAESGWIRWWQAVLRGSPSRSFSSARLPLHLVTFHLLVLSPTMLQSSITRCLWTLWYFRSVLEASLRRFLDCLWKRRYHLWLKMSHKYPVHLTGTRKLASILDTIRICKEEAS